MFTQCQNCKAIFTVSMREVTVSKGFLRCSECLQVFDSSKSISTSMQKPFAEMEIDTKGKREISPEQMQTIKALDSWQSSPSAISVQDQLDLRQSPTKNPTKKIKTPVKKPSKIPPKTNRKTNKTKTTVKGKSKKKTVKKKQDGLKPKWPVLAAVLLGLLLLFQVGFNYRHLLLDKASYAPEKIQMLNHNVFAHPIEKDVLLISASIENTADFDQPYPFLEVRLTNSKAQLVALRRFSPNEYLDNYSPSLLLTRKRPTSIKLKIKDPGSQATRFQFDFL